MIQATFPFLSHSDEAKKNYSNQYKFLDTNGPHQEKKEVFGLGSYKITAYSLYMSSTEPRKKPIHEFCTN